MTACQPQASLASSSCCHKLLPGVSQSEASMSGNQPIRGRERHEARTAAPFPGMFPPLRGSFSREQDPDQDGHDYLFLWVQICFPKFPQIIQNTNNKSLIKRYVKDLKQLRFDKVHVLLLMTILHAQAACGQDTPRSWESLKYDSWPMSRILERFSPDIGKSAVFENILLSQCCPGVQYCSAS